MKTKYFRKPIRAARRSLASFKHRALLWLARHSFIFNKFYLTTPQRRFLIVKAKLINFYQNNVRPRFETLKVRLGQTRQRVANWLTKHRRRLQIVAIVATAFAAGVALTVLWQQSPALRRVVTTAATTVVAALAGLWRWLRGRSAAMPKPVPLQQEPDGRL